MPDERSPQDALARIARGLGVEEPLGGSNFERIGQILDHIEIHRHLLLRGLDEVTTDFHLLMPEANVSRDELDCVRRLLGLWDVVPAFAPPLQPQSASPMLVNPYFNMLLEAHDRLVHYFFGRAYGRLPADGSSTPRGRDRAPSEVESIELATRALEALVARTTEWIETRALRSESNLRAELIELELAFLRSNNAMRQEASGRCFYFMLSHIHRIVDVLLPQLKANMPAAAAEALNVLNLILLGTTIEMQMLPRFGGRQPPSHVPVLAQSLAIERQLWFRSQTPDRANAAAACFCWLRSLHSDYDAETPFIGVEERHAADWNPTLLAAQSQACPLFGLMVLDAIVRMEFQPFWLWRATDTTAEHVFDSVYGVLRGFAANPGCAPYRLRYRPVVRAILMAEPPIVRRASVALRQKRSYDALDVLLEEWGGSALGPIRRSEPLIGVERSYQDWRSEVERLVIDVAQTRDEVQEDASLFRKLGVPDLRSGHETALDAEKGDLHVYFAHVPASSLRGDRPYRAASLCATARELGVDLLVLSLADVGLGVIHYSSAKATWQTAGASTPLNRPLLGQLGVASGTPVGELAGFRSLLPGGITPREAAARVANFVVYFTFQHLDLGPRTAVLLAPEFATIPLMGALTKKFIEVFGNDAQIARLAAHVTPCVPSGGVVGGRELSFAAFEAPGLTPENIWCEAGLAGEHRTAFTPGDVVTALCDGTDIVHLATHGVLDFEAPAFSYLKASELPLFSFDLFDIPVRAKLALLNTCSSAGGGSFGAAPGFSPLDMVLAGGGDVVVGNLFPVLDTLAAAFAMAFQTTLFEERCCAEAFARGFADARKQSDAPPSFTIMGRSLESLFSPDWTRSLLRRRAWR